MMEQRVKVALPVPLFEALDYLLPSGATVEPGRRVRVPLGSRTLWGMTISGAFAAPADGRQCKPVHTLPEEGSLIPEPMLRLCEWAAEYYHHPIGEVLAAAVPARLREKDAPDPARRGRRKRVHAPAAATAAAPDLSAAQADAVETLGRQRGFHVSLLDGVTGSGKTEVYLHRVHHALEEGRQALVLTPEIALTPQLIERFRARFGNEVGAFHSGLGERERALQWLACRDGRCRVLIGTRSAVFAPMPQLGLIVVDEEHDASFKQQEGFRYSARDLAIMRAQQADVPVILGSATPSLETLHNAQQGRYKHLRLPDRAGAGRLPRVSLLDLRGVPLRDGLSPALVASAEAHLAEGGQVLVFVNRRGYAPALLCHDCGWTLPCPHCDARLSLHRARGRMVCHHCGSELRVPARCGQCSSTDLIHAGQGTERVEAALRERFPTLRVERMDSDRARRAGELDAFLRDIGSGEIRVLVGTQMLAKGHDFHRLSLVGVIDADDALYSSDFRAVERMAQLLTQVSGRAGRGARAGEVLVQTHQPEHPALRAWLRGSYAGLAPALLDERRMALLPPFAHLALLRADALDAAAPLVFLREIAQGLRVHEGVDVLGPAPAPMERRANRTRAQLLLRAGQRPRLQALLGELLPALIATRRRRGLRWSLDVDPVDLY